MVIAATNILETFKKQFERKFIPEHVQQRKELEFLNLKQGQMIVAVHVHTFLHLSEYAIDLIDSEAKKVKRSLNGLNPAYKKIVVACHKPTTFDDAIDRAFTAEDMHREEMVEDTKSNSSSTTSSWFKKGGKFKNKGQKNVVHSENRPICETHRKAHQTETCWRTTGACLICGSLEQRMSHCPRARRDNRASYRHPAQRQAAVPAPPQWLALSAPSVWQQQQCQGRQHQ